MTQERKCVANFYIADLHIGHANVIKFDKRPFVDVDDMKSVIVKKWNEAVTNEDTVYILGDFIWHREDQWPAIVKSLRGRKVLVKGNHDPISFSAETRALFDDISDYKEIDDGDRHVILSHYPMPFHKNSFRADYWMLYGHVHITSEYKELLQLKKKILCTKTENQCSQGHFINVGCMMPWMDYAPKTLQDIIDGSDLVELNPLQSSHESC